MVKDSFIFYKEWYDALRDLTGEVRLEVYEAAIMYATEGKLPELKPMANLAFKFIKSDIDRNIEKYDEVKEQRSVAGEKGNLKRWHPELYAEVEKGNLTIEEARIKTSQKVARNRKAIAKIANVAVNVNVNDNVIKEKYKKENCIIKNSNGDERIIASSLNDTLDILVNDMIWLESICMNNKLTRIEAKDLLIDFFAKLQDEEVLYKEEQDAKRYFSNWIKTLARKPKTLKTSNHGETRSTELHQLLQS